MAFEAERAKMPASIGDINIVLADYIDEETQSIASYEVQVLQEDGSMFRVANGDLIPYLSAAQISGLQALMADLRIKAQALIP